MQRCGFAVLQSDRVAAARWFANSFASAEMNEQYNLPLSSGPTNAKAQPNPNPALTDRYYKPDELEKFAYFVDFEYRSSQENAWTRRWETEIVPLLRA